MRNVSRRLTTTRIRQVSSHTSRADRQIWALAVSADEKTIVSAGADSIATFWEDCTVVEQEERNQKIQAAVQQ